MYGPAQSFTRIFVIGIIAMLIAVLLSALSRVRQHSLAVRCAANLQQISIAFKNYLIDARQKKFWRSANSSLEGMDWYVYGGQETGNVNIGQAGLFNRFQPRPLNPYVGGKTKLALADGHVVCADLNASVKTGEMGW